jgi:hypothetical protein
MFDSLVHNAVDFLKRSVSELEGSPKYSVINFYAAIELFLKARLMVEHWSLIISKPEIANLNKFVSGDFHSVGMKEATERLSSIAGEELSKEEKDCFNQIREHRNKLVHFFHPDYATNPNTNTLQDVVAEQCKGWFYLHRLLSSRWSDQFDRFTDDIAELDRLMHQQREFLRAKYNLLQPQIQEQQQRGIAFRDCPSCGFAANKEEKLERPLVKTECLVCSITSREVRIACPDCGTNIYVYDMGEGECANCGTEVDIGYLTSQFDDRTPAETLEGEALAYCSECEHVEEPTVIPHGDRWLCLFCQTFHEEVGHCEWCASFVTGDLEDSLWSGCVMCEGRSGEGFPD